MTKREAVEILRHADTDSEVDADDYLKAFDMAVSALESESNRDDLTEVVMRYIETFHPDFLKREEHPIYPGHNKDDKVVEISTTRNPALDVKTSELPTAYSPRHTIKDLFKS